MRVRRTMAMAVAGVVLVASTACSSSGDGASRDPVSARSDTSASAPGPVVSAHPAKAAEIVELLETQREPMGLEAIIVKVSVDSEQVVRTAMGESINGVPATPEMSFRNGAVAISYVATLLLQLVDDGKVSLDDKVSKYVPDVNHGDQVTVGQLARMTSGYHEYVTDPELDRISVLDPFKTWTVDELLTYGADRPLSFEPGTNWGYSHTNYVVLGLVIEAITGRPMAEVMKEKVLEPLGLDHTVASQTGTMPEPALHAFTSERRVPLGIAPDTPFTEEATYWNPSWTITNGAVQTSTIDDVDASAIAIGTGRLLSPQSYRAMSSTDLRGFGTVQDNCSCGPQSEYYSYGIGLITSGDWFLQNPKFGGYAGAMAYLPSEKVAISIFVTFAPSAFAPDGNYPNHADTLWRMIGAIMSADNPPPMAP